MACFHHLQAEALKLWFMSCVPIPHYIVITQEFVLLLQSAVTQTATFDKILINYKYNRVCFFRCQMQFYTCTVGKCAHFIMLFLKSCVCSIDLGHNGSLLTLVTHKQSMMRAKRLQKQHIGVCKVLHYSHIIINCWLSLQITTVVTV